MFEIEFIGPDLIFLKYSLLLWWLLLGFNFKFIGIVGATGAVGKEIVGCLERRNFDVESLRIFGTFLQCFDF